MLMLAGIFVFFILTYMPSVIVKTVDKCYYHSNWHAVSYVINWASVVINPIIYVVSQQKYQEAIMYLWHSIRKLFIQEPSQKMELYDLKVKLKFFNS